MNKKHKICYAILQPLVVLFLWLRFGYRCKTAKNLPENYIVLSNHCTDYDPLFVGASFPRQMYFVASEHISRWKVFPLLNYFFAPILRYKGTVASSTVLQSLKRIKNGASVCIFAEGARCWDGITAPILPSTGKMIKTAKCGLVTYKITGGYFVSPNWSYKNLRRGPIYGAPVNIYTKEQIAEMSVDEINEIINRDLHEDAYERQLLDPKPYKGKNLAKDMENLLFLCPECRKMDTLRSEGNSITCTACGHTIHIDRYGMLENAPYKTVRDLAAWQKSVVTEDVEKSAVYTAQSGTLMEIAKQQETTVAQGAITLSETGLTCGDTTLPLADIADMAIHGRDALVFSVGRTYYELVPDKGYNTLKFLLLFHAYKNRHSAVPVS